MPDILERPSIPAAALPHGGDLGAARRLFPGAPEPFIDLSTGINPIAYPLPAMASEVFARLPEPGAERALLGAAARAYGAPSAASVVAAPGTQSLLPLVASLVLPGRAVVLSPTYAEHARTAAAAGHRVTEAADLGPAADADLVTVVNPNNPDGRVTPKATLRALAADLAARGGLLAVDEAFMDVGPPDASMAPEAAGGGLVVLRSFGKFYGLAGLRLGFAVTDEGTAARLRAALGPWAVSGPAIAAGTAALADDAWARSTRSRLARDARRLDGLIERAGLARAGGTSLYRLARSPTADAVFRRLGRAGLLVRRFPERPGLLRFGLPADEGAWTRLSRALP